jgi:AbrB family looped-hinge helix DNA binding protein
MKTERIVKPFGTGQITIPAEFRRRLGIGLDTLLKLTLTEESIEIRPVWIGEVKEPVREYSREDIERFVVEDKLDPATAAKVRELLG